ncbi:uncharacterized protein LOC130715927 [Lotus japonicus]|uniref:uncharacterized protein LOC130715927 n=1 Tax=Lotus japonicus TaxID=34305 RepID=UPI00258F762D|nr:uncharacterized protein LOC130715927 [Lotus japonicus]
MADSTIKILSIVFFLFLMIYEGYGTCSLDDLAIKQYSAERSIHGKPIWMVSITNKCSCPFYRVHLTCHGFQTALAMDPSVLRVLGDVCILNGDNPIYRHILYFEYAWDQPFPFTPASVFYKCP